MLGSPPRISWTWRQTRPGSLRVSSRDLGLAVTGVTRREESLALAGAAPHLAREADRHVFGPRPPEAGAAAAYWEDVDAYRAALSSQVTRGRRLRAALSLRTFRPGRWIRD